MAITWLEWDATFSSNPTWYRCVGYEEIARDSTSATINIYLKLKLKGSGSSTFYGFPAKWDINDGTDMNIKGSERWYGGQDYRTFTTTYKVNANAGGGSATFKLNMWSTSGGNASFDKTFTFNYSKWNTKPYWNANSKVVIREYNAGGRVISDVPWGAENSYKLPENVNSLYISWDNAIDPDGNPITYELYEQKNDGGWNRIDVGNDTCHQYAITSGSGTQGDRYDYYVKARDSYGEYADGEANATQVQKNNFTRAMLNHSGSVYPSTANIAMTYSGANNTNGNATFNYNLTCDGITVYNSDKFSGGNINVAIYKSGNLPTTPYIKYEDLKNKLAGSFKGNIRFTLETINTYGSSGSDYEDIWVDLQQAPTAFSFGGVSGATAIAGGSYYIPSERELTLTWGASTDPNGTPITYDLYYAYDNVVWIPLKTGLTTNTFTGKLPSVNKLTVGTFRVVARTAYGTTKATEGGRIELHFIRFPSVTTDVTRTQSDYTINGKVVINTSIPNVKLSYVTYKIGSSSSQNATISGFNFTIKRPLAESNTETVTIIVTDQVNLALQTGETTTTVQVSRYMPMLSIREKGIGINAIPDGSAKLIVNGGLKVDGVRVGGAVYLPQNTDLNDIRTEGSYYNPANVDANTMKNLPSKQAFSLLVERHAGCKQTFTVYNYSDVATWIRNYYSGQWSDWKRVLTSDCYQTAGAGNPRGKVAFINNDGVMEVGQYIDFHYGANASDFDSRLELCSNGVLSYNHEFQATVLLTGNLRLEGNDFKMNNKRALVGWGSASDPLIVNYNKDFAGGTRIQGTTEIIGDANILNLKGLGENHVYVGFYPRADGSTRGSWMGYGNSGANDFNISSDLGNLILSGKDRVVANNLHASGWLQSPQIWVTNGGGIFSGHNNAYILNDHANGNVTLSASGGDLYLGYHNTNKIVVSQQHWDLGASSGCMLRLTAPWEGTAGTEPAIFNSKGKGWGFLGNADWAWYRIYGSGGTVSQRHTKYDIHKYDDCLLYDYVKQMNTYGYRTISNTREEDGTITETLKRSDMQLGCMIEEMPTEIVFYDEEGGSGGAVDNYSYTTMVLGATKILQKKVEILETTVEKLSTENNTLKQKIEEIERMLKNYGIS